MLTPVVPHIRSSDLEYLTNPFLYYLRRRLGLCRAFDAISSNTLSTGSWFHRAFEVWNLPEPKRLESLWASIASRESEIATLCGTFGVGSDQALAFQATERRRALEAYYRLTCALDTPHGPHAPLSAYLSKNYEEVGPPELIVTVPPREGSLAPRTIQIDRLLRSKDTGDLWIFDLKSTTLAPSARASRCPIEFQTQHYIHTLTEAVKLGLCPHTSPNDVVGGMGHIVLSNFDLKFGQADRPYHWEAQSTRRGEVVRSGTVKECPGPHPHSPPQYTYEFEDRSGAQPILSSTVFTTETEALQTLQKDVGVQPKKVFAGEPSTEMYLKRIRDRYNGTGQYTHELEALRQTPPTLVSLTYGREVDKGYESNYSPMLSEIEHWASIEPDPLNFPKTSSGLEEEDNPFLPFFVYREHMWQEIMDRERLLVRHRDIPLSS